MNYTFLYKIDFQFDSDIIHECGLIYADNFTNAAKELERLYGDDLLTVYLLEPYDISCFTFAPKDFDTVKQLLEEAI